MASRGSIRLEDARNELLNRISEFVPSEFASVVKDYFQLVSPVDIVGRNPQDLAAMIKTHFELGHDRAVGETKVQTVGDQQLVRTVSWYDNEMSYVSQLVRTVHYFAQLISK